MIGEQVCVEGSAEVGQRSMFCESNALRLNALPSYASMLSGVSYFPKFWPPPDRTTVSDIDRERSRIGFGNE